MTDVVDVLDEMWGVRRFFLATWSKRIYAWSIVGEWTHRY